LPNVHLGTSVGVRKRKDQIDLLRQTPAAVRFLSLEPLLEDLGKLDLTGIHWVIVGGESGKGARQCKVAWISSIVEQCRAANVPIVVKQLGKRPDVGPHDAEEGFFPRCWRCGHYDFGPCSDGTLLCNGCDAQWQGRLKDSKGGDMDEWPADLRVREFPALATIGA